MAKRIQRQRTKGWRMPEGAVYVGRPTKWGNPFPLIEALPRKAGMTAIKWAVLAFLGQPDSMGLIRKIRLVVGQFRHGDVPLGEVSLCNVAPLPESISASRRSGVSS